MKLRTRHVALILSAAAIAAAGCGSSSSSKTTAAPTPATPSTPSTGTGTTTTPTSGFSAQLNTLCKQANQAVTGAHGNLPKAGTAVEPIVTKMEALMPSAAQKADFEKFIATAKQTVTAAKANNTAALQKAQSEGKGLGVKLGAPACE